jgi:protein pelota
VRVLDQDTREGRVKVRVDTMDDLWHLSHLVQPGDRVTGVTQRRLEDQRDMVRDKGGERVTVTLTVEVEDVEFHEASQRLRVLGVIREAPEEVEQGTHHTIGVAEHDWLEITKPDGWPKHQLDRVEEAVEEAEEPEVVVVAMDDEEATVAVLHAFGPREIGRVTRQGGGKQYDVDRDKADYFDEVRRVLATTAPEGCPVVVVGPGFAPETFAEHLDREPVADLGPVSTDTASQPGMPGVHEAIKRGHVERVAESSRVSKEARLVDDLLARIGQDGGATYGRDEVEHALNLGAADTVLVVDDLVHDEDVQDLLDLAHETGADVHVVGTGHDAGETLASLTGVAALLRFDPGDPPEA